MVPDFVITRKRVFSNLMTSSTSLIRVGSMLSMTYNLGPVSSLA